MQGTITNLGLAIAISSLFAGAASAQLFSDAVDNSSNFTLLNGTESTTNVVDYSALGIPEAPNSGLTGGTATTGFQFTSNATGGGTGSANAILGSAPVNFSGTYSLQFDMWLNTSQAAIDAGTSTEQGLWGVGRSAAVTAIGRPNRLTDGDGTFGWLSVENGYGTEDAAIFDDTTELNDIGDTNDVGADTLFNDTFDTTLSDSANDAPANQWVQVNVVVDGGQVDVYFNEQLWFSEASSSTNGFAFVGYEDPFSSTNTDPQNQYGVIDNVLVFRGVVIPEPTSIALLGLGGLMMLRRRR